MNSTNTFFKMLHGSFQLKCWSGFTDIVNRCKTITRGSVNFILTVATLFIFSMMPEYSTAQITTGFELDGNAFSVAPNPPDDWDLIYSGTSSAQVTTGVLTD